MSGSRGRDRERAMMELRVKRIHPEAKLPVYSHPGDAGLDLFSVVDRELAPGEVFAVPTGIQVAVPAGHVGLVWDKSGISLKSVHRLAGVVDSGYRGEVQVVMINLGVAPFPVRKGMKIAQMLVQPVAAVEVVESDSLDDTARGHGGFGSTGLY
jgi:dUTP pyrophosphatase